MKIERSDTIFLKEAEFGSVVTLADNGTPYLVMSSMDGTGNRHLVSLVSGTLKDHYGQFTSVRPVNAVLKIG